MGEPPRPERAVSFVPDEEDLSFGARDRPHRSTRRMLLTAIVVALLVGAGIGIGIDRGVSDHRAPTPAPTPSASSSSRPSGALALQAGTGRCAQQRGTDLQLGVELVNVSGASVTLLSVRAVTPLGGLVLTSIEAGSCGSLSRARPLEGQRIAAGGSTWIAATFSVVQGHCPAPDPVQLEVAFRSGGSNQLTRLDAFPDLGGVPYSACKTPRS